MKKVVNLRDTNQKVIDGSNNQFNLRMVAQGDLLKFSIADNKFVPCDDDRAAFIKNIEGINFIKIGCYSTNEGKLLNPWGTYYTNQDEYRFNPRTNENYYKWVQVSDQELEQYKKFFETKNQTYLLNIEREIFSK